MSRKLTLMFIILLCLVSSGQLHKSRAASPPILASIAGDIWSWDGPGSAPKSRTQWGYNNDPILSPDGKTIAYKSVAKIAVDVIKAGNISGGAGDLPATIWLLDVASNDAKRIADQPANASFSKQNVPDFYGIRSEPSWSPDGTQLAWTEMAQGGKYQLVVYSVDSGTSKVLVKNVPPQQNYEGYAPMLVSWGESGIAVLKRDAVTDSNGLHIEGSVLIYDATSGKLIRTSEKVREALNFFWILNVPKNNTWEVAIVTYDSNKIGWKLVNLANGKVSDLQGIPQLFNPQSPDGLHINPASLDSVENWAIADASGAIDTITLAGNPDAFLSQLKISPDGDQIAYVTENDVTITDGKLPVSTTLGKDLRGIVWGQLAWRIA